MGHHFLMTQSNSELNYLMHVLFLHMHYYLKEYIWSNLKQQATFHVS
jgi:hypothetical protein